VMFGRLYAPNLTSGRGGIASRYDDQDFARVLLHGVRKDGHSVVFMPSQDFKLTARDAAAVITYLRSLPPVDATVPEIRLGPIASALAASGKLPLLPAELIDHEHAAFAVEPTATDAVSKGAHVVQTAGCIGCHTPTFEGGAGPPRARRTSPRSASARGRRRISSPRCARTSGRTERKSPMACRSASAACRTRTCRTCLRS